MNKKRKNISIIIPTLNEAENLSVLIPAIKKAMGRRNDYEIIIIDDNSKDGTPAVIKKLSKKYPVQLVVRKKERGLSTAVIRGFREATGQYIGVMDADLSHPPELLPKLVVQMEKGIDVVVPSRYMKGGGCEEWPFVRQIISRVATSFARMLTKIHDPMSGYFFINRDVLYVDRLNPIGYKILLEILVKCPYHSFIEIPYIFRNRNVGKSKLDGKVYSDYIKHLIRLYAYKIKVRVQGRRREI